ncbi:MAG: DUF6145 family protein [Lachnospiraceae bacterium]|nr:DUF6145 family protein [Lachnospiraceae bacterium]
MEKIVLCGANAYEKKYYFNEDFAGLPSSIQDEIHIICVLFTEEIGGVFTLVFDEEGTLNIETDADEGDLLYDEIGSGLLVHKVMTERQDLFESLEMYYRIFILHENPSDILLEE